MLSWNNIMAIEKLDTLIIGGGLSGIYAAWLLSEKNKSFVLLEARPRCGGRILSAEYKGFFYDLGPSWYWPSINQGIVQLMNALNLKGYQQFEYGMGRFQGPDGDVKNVRGYSMEPPCWRVAGGMMAFITNLCKKIPESAIRVNHPVCSIEQTTNGALVSVGELEREPWTQFYAEKVILALPPRLAASTILFTPDLSHDLTQAMLRIGTWMAGQAKFYAFYDKPYWRETGLSGEGFSQLGPVGEFHDGSNDRQDPYGLTGFISVPAKQRSDQKSLAEAILSQLALFYGESASQPIAFNYHDWAQERFTATQFDLPPMYEHPMYHPPAGKTCIWDGMIHFAGTETAEQYGGYLEGALISAERAIMNLTSDKIYDLE